MSIRLVLKSLKEDCQAKKSFMVGWQAKKLVIKGMNMFLRYRIDLKNKR